MRFNYRLIMEGWLLKIYRLFSTLLAIIIIACLLGLQANATGNPLQYSQFYTITLGPAPSNSIGAPQQFEIAGNIPSRVYLGEQMQSVPYTQYQSYSTYTGANSLWIEGATTWTQYAVVPQGASVSLLAISPTGGSGILNFVDSDGQTYSRKYLFYPNSQLTFYADTIGRYTLSFAINSQASNQVVIDVVGGTYTQPENYPGYYPGYYLWDYYPSYYYPWHHYPRHNQVQCPAGYRMENGICVPSQVNTGTDRNDGINLGEEQKVQCPAGYHMENGICVPSQVNTGTDRNDGVNLGEEQTIGTRAGTINVE
jgi:hypothetical protein